MSYKVGDKISWWRGTHKGRDGTVVDSDDGTLVTITLESPLQTLTFSSLDLDANAIHYGPGTHNQPQRKHNMTDTKTTTYLATEDNGEGMDTYVVTHRGEDITIVRTHSSQAQPDYHTTFTIDGNSNASLSWKHMNGEGSVNLPHGVVLDLFPMSHIMQAEEGNTWSTTRFFKELVTTMGGK